MRADIDFLVNGSDDALRVNEKVTRLASFQPSLNTPNNLAILPFRVG
jgi:hypothetical protein